MSLLPVEEQQYEISVLVSIKTKYMSVFIFIFTTFEKYLSFFLSTLRIWIMQYIDTIIVIYFLSKEHGC